MIRYRSRFAAILVVLVVCFLNRPGAQSAQGPGSSEATDRFYEAIRGGDLAAVRQLLDKGTDVNIVERRGGATPLMHAAAIGSLETVRLLLDRGANVNAHSNGGATALMWAATDLAKVRLLIERGADVNAVSENGRTALQLAAMSDRSAPIVRLLLEHGADAKHVDGSKTTTLIAATTGNDTESIRLLIDAGADVNAGVGTGTGSGDILGLTPLINAASHGNADAVRLLLAHKANVNVVSGPPSATVKNGTIALGAFTPLLLASTYGPDSAVKALIAAGADVNVKDARGMTPLMLAVSSDHGDPAVVKTLLGAGADPNIKSLDGESAMDWALKSGNTTRVAALRAAKAVPAAGDRPETKTIAMRAPSVRAAVERGLTLTQRASGTFFTNGGCAACHAQNVTDIAVGEARSAGIPVDEAGSEQRVAGASAQFSSIATKLLERLDAPVVDIPLYALAGFAGARHAADRATDALVFNVAAQQSANGAWHFGFIARPPMEDGDVATTAVAIRALKIYGLPGRQTEMNDRISRALDWMRSAKTTTTQDRTFQLLGLAWGGAQPQSLQGHIKDIVTRQRADGGWSQTDQMTSDAYATGSTLFALLSAGVPANDAAVRRAIDYLMSTQRADGSWFVRSRAPKIQPYFDGGFPYDHDQWISSMATGWATAALASSLHAESSSQRASR